MPLRPFPLALSAGIDICHVPRIKQILIKGEPWGVHERPHRFLRRLLSAEEQREFYRRFYQKSKGEVDLDVISKHLAGRWAAKEATIKAVKWRKLSFLDVHIASLGANGGICAVVLDKPAEAATRVARAGNASGPSRNAECDRSNTAFNSSGVASDDSQLDRISGQVVQVSISHDGEYATAVCIAPRNE